MQIYLVGGAVRDQLLHLPVHERDWVVVGSTPEEMLALGYQQVGKDFPVFLHPDTHEEYALARTERKTAAGYTGFTVYADAEVTLEEDLIRRDLTINAMAQTSAGKIIDPFNGQEDLQEGFLRHVSSAFVEDPVRILRVARFAARFAPFGFRVAHSTHALMKKMVANGEVDALVPERVWKELSRALSAANPEKFFTVLHACGALTRILPQLADLFPVPAGGHRAAPSAALQALIEVSQRSQDTRIRFAALLRHLPLTPLKNLCQHLRVPNEYAELAQLLAQHFEPLQQADKLDAQALLTLLEQLDAFRREARFALLLQTCQRLAPDRQAAWQRLQQAQHTAAQVEARQFVEQGLKGVEIKQALQAERVRVIDRLDLTCF